MLSDMRLALRQLAAAKGFTITAVLTLALGIGANTGIFTLVHALLMQSLPVAHPEQIFLVGDGDNCCVLGGLQGRYALYSYPLYRYLRENTPEFEEMSAFQGDPEKVGVRPAGATAAQAFSDQFVSGNYFQLFGLRARVGRLIAPADDVRGAPPVAVMSDRVWREHFGANPSILGTNFVIDGAPYTLIGVAPPGFFGADRRADPPDFWMPLADEPVARGKNSLLNEKTSYWLYVMGRAAPGMQSARVEAKMNTELRQWLESNDPQAAAQPRDLEKQHITLAPGGAGLAAMRETYRSDLQLLMGITGLVLLIACANLANLQLARGAASAGQAAIRVALGAPRSRLIRQVLVESLLLAVAGGAAGVLVASETATLLIRLAFHGAEFVPIDASPALPVLGFAFLLSLATGVIFGVAPAWSASRADPAAALRGAGRAASVRLARPQKAMVVLQTALSLALLASAGLMTRTLRNLTAQQFGFRMQGTVVVDVNAGFRDDAPEKLASIYTEIDRRLRELPGVRNVALTLYSPMSGNNWQMGATLEEHPQQPVSPSWDRVSGSFFDAVGARLLRGRTFDGRDTPDATHVAVVNQAFAEQYFPNEDPIGKRFGLGGMAHRADYRIVGVVNTIRFRNPRGAGRPMFFLPLLQMWKNEWNDVFRARSNLIESIVLRVNGEPEGLGMRVQRALGSIDPNLTVLRVAPVSEHLGELLDHEELIGTLAQVFAGLALLLASLGLYGVTAYSVARRTSELGLRTALGATRGNVVRMILGGALRQAALGIAMGVPAALAAGRLLAGIVFGVKTGDPLILAGAALVLAGCAALAAVIPAARASSIDPVQALRVE